MSEIPANPPIRVKVRHTEMDVNGTSYDLRLVFYSVNVEVNQLLGGDRPVGISMRRYPRNLGTFLFLIHSSGCRPYFIFLSFYSVVHSI